MNRNNFSKSTKEKPYHTEGLNNSERVLIDYVNVDVHVFQQQYREFYKLEEQIKKLIGFF